MVEEFHRHRLRPIHVLLEVFYDFLMDLRHFRAQAFLTIDDTILSVLLLVKPYVFNAHTRTEQIILHLLLAEVVDACLLVELEIIQHIVFIIVEIVYYERRCHLTVSV